MSARALLVCLALSACTTAIDPGKPRQYPCGEGIAGDPSAHCPEGWRCGLEGYCHDTAVPGPYRCASDSDCEGGYRCGVAGVCYDRADAGSIECRRDAGDLDCAEGWRCGLSEKCHDRAVGAAYACESDLDCELTWRCGPQQLCVDSVGEALRAPPAPSSLQLERLDKLPAELPDHYARGNEIHRFGQRSQPGRTLALVKGTKLTQVAVIAPGGTSVVRQVPLDGGAPRGVAAVGERAFVLDGQGIQTVRVFTRDGGTESARLPGFPGFDATALRATEEGPEPSGPCHLGSSAAPPLLIAFSPDQYALFDTVNDLPLPPSALPINDAGVVPSLFDLGSAWGRNSSCTASLVAASSDGLFYAVRDEAGFSAGGTPVPTPEWIPFHLGPVLNAQCPEFVPDAGYLPVRVRSIRSSATLTFAAEVVERGGDAGASLIAYGTSNLWSSSHLPPCELLASAPNVCAACRGAEETLTDFRPSADGTVTVRCRGPSADGGRSDFERKVAMSNCKPVALEAESNQYAPSITRPNGAAVTTVGFADELGRLWEPGDGRIGANQATLLERVPWVVSGSTASVLQTRTARTLAHGLDPRVGLTPIDATQVSYDCGGVRGAPWTIREDDTFSPGLHRLKVVRTGEVASHTGDLAALAGTDQLALDHACSAKDFPGFSGLLATTRTGGKQLLVTGGDTLWAGDVTEVADGGPLVDGGVPVLSVKMVPLIKEPISSITALAADPDAGTELLAGYLLIEQRLFRFQADNPVRWRSDEVDLPPGEPIAVWADGARGRVGYRSGEVYSLPSRVLIGAALAAGPVREFADVCGHGYALSDSGLYRLVTSPDGGSVGQWSKLALGEVLDARYSFEGAKLYPQGNELLLFTSKGGVVRVEDPGCPAVK